MNREQKLELIYNIFSPSAPIENIDLFVGRHMHVEKIKSVIEERGEHAVLYGGRGVGKTSLANIVTQLFKNITSSKITCNRTDDFKSIWEKAVTKIKLIKKENEIGFNKKEIKYYTRLRLPNKDKIDASDIENVFYNIFDNILIIFDEFDSINDKETKNKMADTIKTLSDNISNITILIVGIGNNVNQLIGKHPSLERCLKQIEMTEMTKEESASFVMNSMNILKIDIKQNILDKIIEYSSGFPHYTHLLCKFVSKNVVDDNTNTVTENHFNFAVKKSIENSDHSIRTAYKKAISSAKKKNQFEDVVLACAMASTDENNLFSTDEVLDKFNKLTTKVLKKESINYNLGMLCKKERAEILEKHGRSGKTKYKLKNPLMKAFVKLKLHNKK